MKRAKKSKKKTNLLSQLSNPFSTGGGGGHFEAHVQASFVLLMLTKGFVPYLPCWPIAEIKLQGKVDGYDTDDFIVTIEESSTKEKRKLLGQIKHSVDFTRSDRNLPEVIAAMWSDFNKPHLFSKGKDALALITGPLSKTEIRSVQWLLNQARSTKDSSDFFQRVGMAKFSPSGTAKRLEVFRHHLQHVKKNITDEEIYQFLRHFFLLVYDLGEESSVVLSLLRSHIAPYEVNQPEWLFSRVVDVVQESNHEAGTITRDTLPEDIKDTFKEKIIAYLPEELTKKQVHQTDWNLHPNAELIALTNLVGTWDESKEADLSVLDTIIGENYSNWIPKIREMLQISGTPFSIKERKWTIHNRVNLLESLGSRLFDQHLDIFKEKAVLVLKEINPAFELNKEERYFANIRGKIPAFSSLLKKGMAEGLALIGNKPDVLINCSRHKGESIAFVAVREILADADWRLWGSLEYVLPILAEAAPDAFLTAVETSLKMSPSPFDMLFAEESPGITGNNYMTGCGGPRKVDSGISYNIEISTA